jgi:hypothetical protein
LLARWSPRTRCSVLSASALSPVSRSRRARSARSFTGRRARPREATQPSRTAGRRPQRNRAAASSDSHHCNLGRLDPTCFGRA